MMDAEIEAAKRNDPNFRNNHIYLANVDRYMKRLLEEKAGNEYIHESIIRRAAALLHQSGKNCQNKLMAIDNPAGKMVNC